MKQLGFDWDRAERDRLIDEADLLPESMTALGSTIKRHWLIAMLRALNGFVSAQHPECWASQKTLAVKIGSRSPNDDEDEKRTGIENDKGVKTVQRTLEALSALSLVIINRRVPRGYTKPVNHYRVVWSELALLSSRRRRAVFPDRYNEREQQDFSVDQQDFLRKQPDFFSDQQDFKSCNLLTSYESIKPTACARVELSSIEQQQDSQTTVSTLERIDDRLVAEYVALEVHGAAELLGRAARRVGWDYLERLLRYFQSQPGAWGPGALRCRVKDSHPGLPVDKGWPPPCVVPKLEPQPVRKYVDKKLAAGLRETRIFNELKAKLGRRPEDFELQEALQNGH